jgi:foldase protein PrsA
MTVTRIGCIATLAAAAIGLAACASESGNDSVVVSIGGSSITKATLGHWMAVLAPDHVVPRRSSNRRYQDLKRQTLTYLISSRWLTGEAADRGVPVSAHEARRRLHEKEASFPNGQPEFRQFLKSAGRTRSDVQLEIDNELASTKLRESLLQHQAKLTTTQIASYYRRHLRRFEHSEERYFYIVENIKTKVAASKLMKEIVSGKQRIAKAGATFYEHLERPSVMRHARTIVKAIFAITPHVVSRPIRVERFYFLIKVTKVLPAYVQTFASVRAAIESKMASEQQRQTLVRFIGQWRRKWTARTVCRPGYVVQKCRQYSGVMAPEEPLSFT